MREFDWRRVHEAKYRMRRILGLDEVISTTVPHLFGFRQPNPAFVAFTLEFLQILAKQRILSFLRLPDPTRMGIINR